MKTSFLNQVGQKYRHFTVTHASEIPELQCYLRELVHEHSQAKIIHIENDDPENVFCLSFQTLPSSSNGVAHILEHTVLCGSNKFPVKDPFFAMSRRSLNTFMNALTGADFTCYPAATQIPKDFYHLLDVYIDAVFHPFLKEMSFRQEGHRLEFSVPNDPSSPLEFKGIVFNEMKGAMSSASSRLHHLLYQELFPDITYGVNSGGEPKDIPNLTYEELLAFHKKFYHPSRCLFYFYGNLPLSQHLDFISDTILDQVQAVPPLPPIPKQTRFTAPKRVKQPYPANEHEVAHNESLIGFMWLNCSILEQEEVLALSVLEIVLMYTDASLLKKVLLRSGFCTHATAYIETEYSEVNFMMTLKGCHEKNADAIESLIFKTLEDIAKNGIAIHLVESAMHQLEFHKSEITGDQAPFGLSLFMRSALLKQHGVETEEGLKIHSQFESLRKRLLKEPRYLSDLIVKHFLQNPHFVRAVLYPDPNLDALEVELEKKKLSAIKEKLSKEEINAILCKTQELTLFQQMQDEDDIEVLPKVTLEDVPPYIKEFDLHTVQCGALKVFHHSCFTNEIIYADLFFDLPKLEESELPYVRFFCFLLSQMGSANRNYAENLEYIEAHTGGVGASLCFNIQANNHDQIFPSLSIRGKALYRKADKLFTLLRDLVTSLDFTDLERLKEVTQKSYTLLRSSLNKNALRYAINLSASGLNQASHIANIWYGLDYFWMIQDLANHFDERKEQLVQTLENLKDRLLTVSDPHLVLACDQHMFDKLLSHHFYGLNNIPTQEQPKWESNFNLKTPVDQARGITSPVAFSGKVFETVSYNHPQAPALSIAACLMDNLVLHTKIREQGGAYGGGAVSNALSGNFYFYSYRDPNIASTLAAYKEAIEAIVTGDFDENDLEEAKLEMLQSIDSPIAPGSRADLTYGWLREGKTQDIRKRYRDTIIHLTKQDVLNAVKDQILPKFDKGVTVVFGGKELIHKENELLVSQGKSALKLENV